MKRPKWKNRLNLYKSQGYNYISLEQYAKKFNISLYTAQVDLNKMLDREYISLTNFKHTYKINKRKKYADA